MVFKYLQQCGLLGEQSTTDFIFHLSKLCRTFEIIILRSLNLLRGLNGIQAPWFLVLPHIKTRQFVHFLLLVWTAKTRCIRTGTTSQQRHTYEVKQGKGAHALFHLGIAHTTTRCTRKFSSGCLTSFSSGIGFLCLRLCACLPTMNRQHICQRDRILNIKILV